MASPFMKRLTPILQGDFISLFLSLCLSCGFLGVSAGLMSVHAGTFTRVLAPPPPSRLSWLSVSQSTRHWIPSSSYPHRGAQAREIRCVCTSYSGQIRTRHRNSYVKVFYSHTDTERQKTSMSTGKSTVCCCYGRVLRKIII
ncbi:hypothetical protein F4778DRAFT_750250 [Xylariomycetidae sp. FL2044]|nr:hypothetical protein F4778DRAFT_750250 [Xylariomycetidae sp. FL2044]